MKFGLVGTGPWAEMCHTRGISMADDTEFVGIYGRDQEKVKELAGKFHVKSFSNYYEMLEEVEAVSFCVPPFVQAEMALEAAKRQKHLLLEKPIAISNIAAESLAEAVQDANVASVVFFIFRFAEPERTFFKDISAISDQLEGAWLRWLGTAFSETSPYKDSLWRKEKGALWDLGPHALSLLLPTLGRVSNISARKGQRDLVQIILEHEHKTTSVLTMSLMAPEAANCIEVAFYGNPGIIKMNRGSEDPAISFTRAVAELSSAAEMLHPKHDLDVTFGLDVVDILGKIENQLFS
ncbi:MAG: Gfo/Idh/MocA family oxidoreductase [Firmicutes bacterium]|nr:Gfo/Idh/MocA family oxidoreductase [Bacillota bacterium]